MSETTDASAGSGLVSIQGEQKPLCPVDANKRIRSSSPPLRPLRTTYEFANYMTNNCQGGADDMTVKF